MMGKFKILVADDDAEIVEFLEVALSCSGYEVIKAYDGQEVLKKAEDNEPDLILLDFYMPKMNGSEVCKILKSKNTDKFVPTIIMTGKTERGLLVKSLESGADEFITKPFEPAELTARVAAMLRIRMLEDRLKNLNSELEGRVKEKTEQIQGLYMETVKSLARALDAKDPYTKKHSENVAIYSVMIAKEMGFSEEKLKKIEQAAQLHDVGKIGISDFILNKKEKLTEEEWREIRTHPVKSIEILEPLDFLDEVMTIIRLHHERTDGTGYPDHKKSGEIPIEAEILAVADAYDAMSNDRSYRKALSREEITEELKNGRGKQFNPEIVEVFLKILEKAGTGNL